MDPATGIQVQGELEKYPFIEALHEASAAALSGSFRVFFGEKKAIVYLREGRVVFAVSNAKRFRLAGIVLERPDIDRTAVARFKDINNDIEFARQLVDAGMLGRREITELIVKQIANILHDLFAMPAGTWHFSPLAQIKDEMIYDVPTADIMNAFAREMPAAMAMTRFQDDEQLSPTDAAADPATLGLQMHESYVLSIFGGLTLDLSQVKQLCSLPESGLLPSLYFLWIAGLISRPDRSRAFSDDRIAAIKNVKIAAKQRTAPASRPATETAVAADEISVHEYLDRVESAETAYDILGVYDKCSLAEIKAAYLSAARSFHPDRFHRGSADVLRRVQLAFTALAQAYEQLKTPDARAAYDFRIRKELDAREARRAQGVPDVAEDADAATRAAAESFEEGLDHFTNARYAEAATSFARASAGCPDNALYHAHYGQVLSFSSKFRHRAESELQTAVRLEPQNWKIREMLVEFFLDMNMEKRAEGELKRFLDLVPGHSEAQRLLRSIS